MPLTSVTKDVATLTLTIVGDYPVSQQRLWDAFTDPRELERSGVRRTTPRPSPDTISRLAAAPNTC
jgi:hypothetical protein